jgi:chromate reductase
MLGREQEWRCSSYLCFSETEISKWLVVLLVRRVASQKRSRMLYAMMCCSSFSSQSSGQALHIALISGSTRTSGPPQPILGPRAVKFVTAYLEERGHVVTEVDPRQSPLLEKPHFSYAKSQEVPPFLQDAHSILNQVYAYVCVTPEYNHAPSPALVNVLNHFGSSTFLFKPSAIVSSSAGQWGGNRAAIALRPILSELGCLPVSTMLHIPKALEILDDEGIPTQDPEDWKEYCNRCFSQLEWWGMAAKEHHRDKADPFEQPPSFQSSPSQRNAPQKK